MSSLANWVDATQQQQRHNDTGVTKSTQSMDGSMYKWKYFGKYFF